MTTLYNRDDFFAYLQRRHINLNSTHADSWRVVPPDLQIPHIVRGLPQLGNVIPRITDGLNVYADGDARPYPLHLKVSNLISQKPIETFHGVRTFDRNLTRIESRQRTQPIPSNLDDF